MQAYFYQFQTLSMEIPGLSGEESTDRFIRGLKPHIRQEIELRGLTTFPDILTTAQRMDAINLQGSSLYSQAMATPRIGMATLTSSHPILNNLISNHSMMSPLPWKLMP